MRTFAQKPKATQQTTSAKSTIPRRGYFGKSHEVNSILHLQRTIGNQAVQRMLQNQADEKLQALPDLSPSDAPNLSKSGQPLDSLTRELMESRFGYDFTKVRVHTGEDAAASTREMGARAYTVGRDVVFGEGRYAPSTNEGKQLLAHELAHVGSVPDLGIIQVLQIRIG